MDPHTTELRSLFETIKDGITASIHARERVQEHKQEHELKLSDVARAIMVRRQYGCVLSAENCNEWLDSKPMHDNIRVAFDLLQIRKSGDGIIGDIPDAFINWMVDNPRLLLTCSSRLGRVRCMFALMPSKGIHDHDATDEILDMWKQKCDVEPTYTGAHICISAN